LDHDLKEVLWQEFGIGWQVKGKVLQRRWGLRGRGLDIVF